jgi:hypothetical protein
LSLVGDTFEAFVNAYIAAKEHAEDQLKRNAEGDYSPDPRAASYPDFQSVVKFQVLWEEYPKKKRKSAATIKKWEPYFRILIRRIGTDDMRKVTEKHLLDWRDELEDRPDLSAATIRNGYMAAMKSFFGWAKLKKDCPSTQARRSTSRRPRRPTQRRCAASTTKKRTSSYLRRLLRSAG